jgi:glycosyltransferase involved in cell wall biosynthesis
MKRIGLYLSGVPEVGGGWQYQLSILDAVLALPGDRYDVTIAIASEPWRPVVAAARPGLQIVFAAPNRVEWLLAGVWDRTGLPRSWWHLLARRLSPFTRTLLAQECDLWIFPSQESWTYRSGVPTVGVIHDLMHRYERRFPEVGAAMEYRNRERRYGNLCRSARAILVDSDVGRQQAAESYPACADKLHVLPYSVPSYVLGSKAPPDFDRRYSLPQRYLFYPAQRWQHKNHLGLIRALALLRDLDPPVHLVFVGADKNAGTDFLELAEQLGVADRVTLFGYVPNEDLVEFYRRARALVMPTFFGPTNIPPLEAMALGCPVAVSRIYAMPGQYGDAALYFDPEAASEIAETMRRLWKDDALCERLRAAGLAVAGSYDQRHFNQRFLEIVDSLGMDARDLASESP